VQRAVFGDDVPDLRKYDPRRYNPGAFVRDAILGGDDEVAGEPGVPADQPVSVEKPVSMAKANGNGARPRPRPRPGPGRDLDDVT
jgi:hypothetical protein